MLPAQFVTHTLLSITASALVYDDFGEMQLHNALIFAAGLFLLILGGLLVTSRPAANATRRRESIAGGNEPGKVASQGRRLTHGLRRMRERVFRRRTRDRGKTFAACMMQQRFGIAALGMGQASSATGALDTRPGAAATQGSAVRASSPSTDPNRANTCAAPAPVEDLSPTRQAYSVPAPGAHVPARRTAFLARLPQYTLNALTTMAGSMNNLPGSYLAMHVLYEDVYEEEESEEVGDDENVHAHGTDDAAVREGWYAGTAPSHKKDMMRRFSNYE